MADGRSVCSLILCFAVALLCVAAEGGSWNMWTIMLLLRRTQAFAHPMGCDTKSKGPALALAPGFVIEGYGRPMLGIFWRSVWRGSLDIWYDGIAFAFVPDEWWVSIPVTCCVGCYIFLIPGHSLPANISGQSKIMETVHTKTDTQTFLCNEMCHCVLPNAEAAEPHCVLCPCLCNLPHLCFIAWA